MQSLSMWVSASVGKKTPKPKPQPLELCAEVHVAKAAKDRLSTLPFPELLVLPEALPTSSRAIQ